MRGRRSYGRRRGGRKGRRGSRRSGVGPIRVGYRM